ncbi:hypothetical protein BKA64DRAFT_276354 [Cadophora sp. MPI-SDFR-AT-0126]|nr:hypothetical protein BKA64DRAFT_276354 [Leotiomycetes sp. MPI-SDFR-AT-0126]
MLDPLTALALTGNILQFIDFGFKATCKARDIYLSADGVTAENADLEVLTTDIATVSAKLSASLGNASGNDSLDDICRRCKASADDLLAALKNLQAEGKKGKWKSARKGLKAVWGKKKVDELRERLEGWRDEVHFHVVVQLRNDINVNAILESERLDTLDEYAKTILVEISVTEDTIREAIIVEGDNSERRHNETKAVILSEQGQTRGHITDTILSEGELAGTRHEQTVAVIRAKGTEVQEDIRDAIHVESENSSQRHKQTQDIIIASHTEAQNDITQTLETLDSNLKAEQEATRRELEQLKIAMTQIEKDMARRDEELKVLLIELSHTHTEKEKRRLQERSNAVTIALYALVTVYEALQVRWNGYCFASSGQIGDYIVYSGGAVAEENYRLQHHPRLYCR